MISILSPLFYLLDCLVHVFKKSLRDADTAGCNRY
uniref:Uncharacterized protein n=1 Tax=Rhizophora mucronata TaxID=61149 RepID=A0A2P2P904_RHIMU